MQNKQLQKYLDFLIKTTQEGTSDSDGHILSLFALALASKGKVYLELGTRSGTTTLPILLAAHLNNGALISVDIKDTDFICPPELSSSWKFIKSDSLEFLKNWGSDKTIDFAFIDDWHTYKHVKQELFYLNRYTTPSSIILLHDLMYDGTEPCYHINPAMYKGEWAYGGPYRAVDELNKKVWEWATLPWSNGLTLLRKKAHLFKESRMKIWAKRWLKQMSPGLERKFVYKYQELKQRYFKK